MAINPEEIDVTTVDKLDDLTLALGNFFSHTNLNGKLGKADFAALVAFLAPYVTAIGGSGFVATTGTALPAASAGKYTIVGAGTFTQTTGGSIVTTELLNILGSTATTWSLVKAIPLPNVRLKTDPEIPIYSTVLAANTAIPNTVVNGVNQRFGRMVQIGTDGNYTVYSWQGGTLDDKLVPHRDYYNSYPFDLSASATFTNGLDARTVVKNAWFVYLNGESKYLTGTKNLRQHYLNGIGRTTGNLFFVRIGIQNLDETYTNVVLEIDPTKVKDIKNVVFSGYLPQTSVTQKKLYMSLTTDFTSVQDINLNSDTTNIKRLLFDRSVYQEYKDIYFKSLSPFASTSFPFMAYGVDMRDVIKSALFTYKGSATKYTTAGTVKKVAIWGAGLNTAGDKYFLRVARQQDGGGYTYDLVEVLVSSITDLTNVVFTASTSSYEYTIVANLSGELSNKSYANAGNDFYPEFEISPEFLVGEGLLDGNDNYPFQGTEKVATSIRSIVKDVKINFTNGNPRIGFTGEERRIMLTSITLSASKVLTVVLGLQNRNDANYTAVTVTADYSKTSGTLGVVSILKPFPFYHINLVLNLSTVVPGSATVSINKKLRVGLTSSKADTPSDQQKPNNLGDTIAINSVRAMGNRLDGTSDIYNGSYSWWCAPHALNYNRNSFLSYVDRFGSQMLFNETADRVLALNSEQNYFHDEHNTPAIFKLSTGKWFSAYTGHQDNRVMRLRFHDDYATMVSWHSGDTLEKSFEREVFFDNTTTYAQIHEWNGRLFVFTRVGLNEAKWQFIVSDDFGVNWTAPADFMVQGSSAYNRVYIATQATGTKWLKVYNYFEVESNEDNRIAYMVMDMETLLCYDKVGGTVLADLKVGPTNMTQGISIYQGGAGNRIRLLDVAGKTSNEVILTVGDMGIVDPTIGKYKVVKFNTDTSVKTVTEICDHGGYFMHTYLGGCYFRKTQSGETPVNTEIFTSRNDGGTWKVEKYIITEGVVSLNKLVDSSLTENVVRPIPPMSDTLLDRGVEVFWIKGLWTTYNIEGSVSIFSNWKSVIKFTKYP